MGINIKIFKPIKGECKKLNDGVLKNLLVKSGHAILNSIGFLKIE